MRSRNENHSLCPQAASHAMGVPHIGIAREMTVADWISGAMRIAPDCALSGIVMTPSKLNLLISCPDKSLGWPLHCACGVIMDMAR